uniref:Fanconi anemia group F protein n=1 Tax=Chinchilla lanigera TaxID=34839 RepID=A0A8C2US81_CHILA
MEPLLQQVERFSEVLSVSRSNHVSTWGPETVRRALQWARYLRHVYRRFGGHGCIRTAVERRLRSQWGPEGFQALGRGDVRLSVNLLQNRALGDAAGRALLQQLFPGAAPRDADAEALQARLAEAGDPGGWLGRLWTRAPRDHFLQVTAVALLQPPDEESGPSRPESPGEESHLLVRWLLERSEVLAAFCRLPAGLLTSVAARHPALFRAYLGLLTDWGRKLHYDLQKGAWVAAESQDVPWEELFHRFQSLGQAPPPLKDKLLTALEACKAQDGDFEVPGLSIWTDLLLALQSSA